MGLFLGLKVGPSHPRIGGVDLGFLPWAAQSLQGTALHVSGDSGEDCGHSGWERSPSGQTMRPLGHQAGLTQARCCPKGSARENEGRNLNGHHPEQSSKAFMFGDQLIIQTSRFEKEDV